MSITKIKKTVIVDIDGTISKVGERLNMKAYKKILLM